MPDTDKGFDVDKEPDIIDSGKLDKQLDEKPDVVYTPFVEIGSRLYEQAYDPETDKVFYIYYDTKYDKVSTSVEAFDGKTWYKPIDSQQIRHRQVFLPSAAEDYKDDYALGKEIKLFLDHWHDEPNRGERTLDVFYALLSWLAFGGKECLGIIPDMPYRRRIGWWGSGKTRWLKAQGAINYRGFAISGAGTEAAIRRRFSYWRGTAIIDEADFGHSDLYATITKILNIGIDKDLGWFDAQDTNDPNISLSFYVYGPKVLTTREEFVDMAFESRCLTAVAQSSGKRPPVLGKKFYNDALHIRNKLLLWRFRHYREIQQQIDSLETTDPTKVFGAEVSPRVRQMLLPLWFVADERFREQLTRLAKGIDETLKAKDEYYQLSLQVRDALVKLLKPDLLIIPDTTDKVRLVSAVRQYSEGVGFRLTEDGLYVKVPIFELAKQMLGGADYDPAVNKKIARSIRRLFNFTVQAGTANKSMAYVPLRFLPTLSPANSSLTNLLSLTDTEQKEAFSDYSLEIKTWPESSIWLGGRTAHKGPLIIMNEIYVDRIAIWLWQQLAPKLKQRYKTEHKRLAVFIVNVSRLITEASTHELIHQMQHDLSEYRVWAATVAVLEPDQFTRLFAYSTRLAHEAEQGADEQDTKARKRLRNSEHHYLYNLETAEDINKLIAGLAQVYSAKRRKGVHISDVSRACLRRSVFSKVAPKPFTTQDAAYLIIGEGQDLIVKRLLQMIGGNPRHDLRTPYGLVGHPDAVTGKTPWESKTSHSLYRQVSEDAKKQLRYYMAALGSLEGVLLVTWQAKNKAHKSVDINAFRLTMDRAELEQTKSELKERFDIFTKAVAQNKPELAPAVKTDPSFRWQCPSCKWQRECVESDGIDIFGRKVVGANGRN